MGVSLKKKKFIPPEDTVKKDTGKIQSIGWL